MNNIMNKKYYYEVDILRGLACILVLLFHLPIYRLFNCSMHFFSAINGVRLFFVISGFVITFSIKLHNKYSTKGNIFENIKEGFSANKESIYHFWHRRYIRLFPCLALLFLSTFIILLYLGVQNKLILESFLGFIRYLSLFFFLDNIVTSPLNPPIMQHLIHGHLGAAVVWTLTCEILFYITMPFMMLYKDFKKYLPVIWLATFILKSLLFIFMEGTDIYYGLLTHFDEFFVGVLIALYYDKIRIDPKILKIVALIAGLNLVLSDEEIVHTYRSYFNSLLASGLLIYVAAQRENIIKLSFIGPALHFIGIRSYFIYLMHFTTNYLMEYPMSQLFNYLAKDVKSIQKMITKGSETLDHAQHLVAIILVIILSDIFYRFIEKPYIEKRKKKYL